MTIYELTRDRISEVGRTTFYDEGYRERQDLQRLLKDHIDIVGSDSKLMVIAEEFGQWDDSRRRIDLLALDEEANLVVIELKRTDDGGHMELQSLRYSAMVSAMTFDQVATAHDQYLQDQNDRRDARTVLLEFLGWPAPDDFGFAQSVRIVLVAADFSKEITTTVLWLNEQGLDIRCVRLRPFKLDERTLLDVQQIIPIPEAAAYQVQVQLKAQQVRASKSGGRDFTRYDVTIDGQTTSRLPKRATIFQIVKHLCDIGVPPVEISLAIPRGDSVWSITEGHLDAAEFADLMVRQGGFDPRRWYCDDHELVYADGATYAFSNQWGASTADSVDRLIKAFPQASISYRPSS